MNYATIIVFIFLWNLSVGEVSKHEVYQQLNATNTSLEAHLLNQTTTIHPILINTSNKTISKDLPGHLQESNVLNSNIPEQTNVIKSRKPNVESIETGALLRGFYVFVGLSSLTVLYLVLRSYRLRSGGQPSNIVRKYGVRAKRSDIEMRHLELDDEDDDILYEINHPSNGSN